MENCALDIANEVLWLLLFFFLGIVFGLFFGD